MKSRLITSSKVRYYALRIIIRKYKTFENSTSLKNIEIKELKFRASKIYKTSRALRRLSPSLLQSPILAKPDVQIKSRTPSRKQFPIKISRHTYPRPFPREISILRSCAHKYRPRCRHLHTHTPSPPYNVAEAPVRETNWIRARD